MKKNKNGIISVFLILAISISISYKSDFFEIAKQIEIYTTLYKELNLYYIDEINPAEFTEKAINSTLNNLDPYTRFYDEQGVEDAKISAEGQYGGIGALTAYRNGNLILREIYKDYPAHKSGLLSGDEIIKIDGVTLKDQTREVATGLLRGQQNSIVKIQVKRQNQILDFSIVRETVEINPVPFYKMIDDEVGYISFIKFNRKASKEVKSAFLDLKSQGMKKLIIDVRHNPGGLLNEAVNIVNFFIPKNKVVVTTKAKLDKWSQTYKTRNQPLDLEIPLTIIIDGRSASASEILAGALQDYDRAVIVGERSFGKGLVQRSRKLSYGTQLKLTISKYYTPSGRCIQELDYANRDEKGNIPKFSDSGTNYFKTKNGRTVYDGGGVEPDIKLVKIKKEEVTKRLLTSDAFYDYATLFYFKNPSISDAESFKLNENDYNSFKNYLKTNLDKFQLSIEKSFEKVIKKAEKDNLNIETQYNSLLAALQVEKLKAIEVHKEEVMNKLSDEIVKRYYFKEGMYQNKLVFDKTIKGAMKIIQNKNEFDKILTN
ncbi:MAG: carboxyl-terminal processing protease [Roseivirga sp.]|jgi:carboxyl-terminal processing protease